MKLHEIINAEPSSYISDEQAEWLRRKHKTGNIGEYFIQRDGTVDVDGDVDLSGKPILSIPVQFGNVTGRFDCFNTKIKSLQGSPSYVGDYFDCRCTNIKSLQGIHKIIKQINGWFACDPTVTHILGLLLIPGIKKIIIDRGSIDKIMNKYLGTGDIISAQDELIDAGFIEQAKL